MSAGMLMTKLLDYVREQAKDVDPKGYQLKGYEGFLKTASDMRGLPGVDFDIKVEGDHLWLRVQRLEAVSAPKFPSDEWKGLLVAADDPNGTLPRIEETALSHRIQLEQRALPKDMHSQIEVQWRASAKAVLVDYTQAWQVWAAGEKPRRKTISLYGDLFTLKHQLEADETSKPHELVWGMGVAAWKLDHASKTGVGKVSYQYPLLTQAMELSMAKDTLAIEVRPRSVDPRLEFDAIATCQVAGAAEAEKAIVSALQAAGKDEKKVLPNPFDPGSTEHLLKLVAGNLDEKGLYLGATEKFPEPGEHLLVSNAWVLLARPRPTNYLLDDVERLKARIAEGCAVPVGPLALVTPPSDEPMAFSAVRFRGMSGYSDHSSGGRGSSGQGPVSGISGTVGNGPESLGVKELYFPLPYNREQVTIVEQLERANGVAVQGPPGTGKTHTIANIICHYLATGRKVLVTSKGEQALEVLQSKIPEAVRPLTVALLAGDREGLRQFRSSIEAIQHNLSQLKEDQVEEKIRNLQAAIERAHKDLAEVDSRVDEIALAQLSDIEVDGVPMRAQKMAQLVLQGEELYGWFDDAIDLSLTHAPALTGDQAAALRDARRKLGQDVVYVQARTPSSEALLPAAQVEQLHRTLVDIRELEESEAKGALLALRASTPEVLQEASILLGLLEQAKSIASDLEASEELWTEELRRKCLQPSYQSEREALEALIQEVQALVDARAEFLKRPVEMPEPALTSQKVKEALERGAQTGKPFGFMAIGAGDAKEQVAAIRVAGLAPTGADDWAHVVRYTRLHSQVLSFSVRWNQFADTLSVPQASGGVAGLRAIETVTLKALKVHQLATQFDARLPSLAEKVFSRAPVQEVRGTSHQMEGVRQHLRSHLMKVELVKAVTDLSTLQEKLAGTSGPVSEALRAFIEKDLGNKDLPPERAVARYAELVSELKRIESLAHPVALVQEFSERVEAAGAVKLALRLRSVAVAANGVDSVWPTSWREAWNWARVRVHLESIESREELRTLASRRRELENGLARLYEEIVSESAWLSTKQGATPKTLSALETYRAAVSRIGKGTGPNATRHRRDAQKAMHDAQGAVPCWVMCHAKVSETLPAELGAFDLVIVDEASQSDIWGLLPVLRGKKILVVGDDKQVSPDPGFISAIHVQELRERFLFDQPFKEVLTPEKSLYDIAATVFAAHKVMLREHFRCVPPIIAYSNRFYDGSIQPLRIPKTSERLDPPLIDVYAPAGTRSSRDTNAAEADFIANEIAAIVANPKLAGRTLGVVSLLGIDQAKLIDHLVRERVDSMELMQRRFECGDARLFQGSERDIMFLTMVVDKGNCHALSQTMHEQRFNVAASRARDRMYLVRSVKFSDLSQVDLRRGLLEHFSKPMDGSIEESKSLIGLCESGFEREVYKMLFNRGYRVVPQVKSGAYRIDMVVEGENDARLAIELDGDEFHGPDRWQADIARQRVLERAGWTFWRCFASTWSLHKDDVFQELLARLHAMGIEPLGALERIPSLLDYWEWPPAGAAELNGQGELEASLSSPNPPPTGGVQDGQLF